MTDGIELRRRSVDIIFDVIEIPEADGNVV